MRVLILGASGLVGRHALEQKRTHPSITNVIAPTRKPLPPSSGLINLHEVANTCFTQQGRAKAEAVTHQHGSEIQPSAHSAMPSALSASARRVSVETIKQIYHRAEDLHKHGSL
jgi:hypothetical protein